MKNVSDYSEHKNFKNIILNSRKHQILSKHSTYADFTPHNIKSKIVIDGNDKLSKLVLHP